MNISFYLGILLVFSLRQFCILDVSVRLFTRYYNHNRRCHYYVSMRPIEYMTLQRLNNNITLKIKTDPTMTQITYNCRNLKKYRSRFRTSKRSE